MSSTRWEEEKYHTPTAAAEEMLSDNEDPFDALARTRVDTARANTRTAAATAVSPQPAMEEAEDHRPTDADWFSPQSSKHYRRREAAAAVATPGSWSAAAPAPQPGDAPPPAPAPANVDGSRSAAQERAAHKAAFMNQWKRQQEAALGLPAGSIDLAPQPLYPPAAFAPPEQPPPPKSKVAFRPLPTDAHFGPGMQRAPTSLWSAHMIQCRWRALTNRNRADNRSPVCASTVLCAVVGSFFPPFCGFRKFFFSVV